MVASPFDFAQVRMLAPIRRLSKLTGGALGTALYKALGGAPAPLVSRGFQLTSIDRLLTKPLFLARNLHDRETIAHSQAVDDYMAHMFAYPGRTFGQLYHAFFRVNSLAGGRVTLHDDKVIDLADVRQPVLSVAGEADVLAPAAAVRHVEELLPNAAEVRIETAPGGHLGVLAGRSARKTTWEYLDEFLAGHDPLREERSAAAGRVSTERGPQREEHSAAAGRVSTERAGHNRSSSARISGSEAAASSSSQRQPGPESISVRPSTR